MGLYIQSLTPTNSLMRGCSRIRPLHFLMCHVVKAIYYVHTFIEFRIDKSFKRRKFSTVLLPEVHRANSIKYLNNFRIAFALMLIKMITLDNVWAGNIKASRENCRISPSRQSPRFVIWEVWMLTKLIKTFIPVKALRSTRKVCTTTLISKRRLNIHLPGRHFVLSSLGHNNMVKTFTYERIWTFGTFYFKYGVKLFEVNPHITLFDVI